MKLRQLGLLVVLASTVMLGTSRIATASVIPVGVGAFGGSTLTTFTGLADGTEVNNLVVDGILFQYSLGNGEVIIDGGPGITNNIAPPNIVSVGDPTGSLLLTLPSLVDTFGYGFAILNTDVQANATTISLFNGATPVGTLTYGGTPDPTFSGGFAGIFSTEVFNRVQITFNSAVAPAWALDNVRTLTSVPEPTTLLLLGTGLAALSRARRRR